MRTHTYLVEFKDGVCREVEAVGEGAAKILAQAEQIKEGMDYTVIKCTQID